MPAQREIGPQRQAPIGCCSGSRTPPSTVPFVKNGIYTIYALKAIGDVPVVQVDGHGLDGRVYAANGWWIRLSRFRPLVSRTQSEDLALFLPLLTTSTQERVDLVGEMLDAAWRESRRD